MGIIQAICISEVRGVQKHAIPEADLTPEWGIVGDAHGGNWHRQVSLLGLEKIKAFRAKGADVAYGAFGENLVVDGFDFRTLPVGTLLAVGDSYVPEGYDAVIRQEDTDYGEKQVQIYREITAGTYRQCIISCQKAILRCS